MGAPTSPITAAMPAPAEIGAGAEAKKIRLPGLFSARWSPEIDVKINPIVATVKASFLMIDFPPNLSELRWHGKSLVRQPNVSFTLKHDAIHRFLPTLRRRGHFNFTMD